MRTTLTLGLSKHDTRRVDDLVVDAAVLILQGGTVDRALPSILSITLHVVHVPLECPSMSLDYLVCELMFRSLRAFCVSMRSAGGCLTTWCSWVQCRAKRVKQLETITNRVIGGCSTRRCLLSKHSIAIRDAHGRE